jgi:hypothetical protein
VFRRTSSQKPGDELYENFRQHFPAVTSNPSSATASSSENPSVAALADGQTQSRYDAFDLVDDYGLERIFSAMSKTACDEGEDIGLTLQSRPPHDEKIIDQDPTPRAQHEPWRFTPSLLDPNSFAFHAFANQPPGYYTPTPGGTNTLYHSQAGDLHTPGMGMGMGIGLGTPFSMPSSEMGVQPGPVLDFSPYGPQHMQAHSFQNYNPFTAPQQPPQPSYAPSTFVHQDTGYETMEHDGSPLDSEGQMESMDMKMHHSPHDMMNYPTHPQQSYDTRLSSAPSGMPPMAEKFRWLVTLNAPTAMIKSADEIPVTYLNKGQAYSVSIVDTTPSLPIQPGTRYRTFIRISFEDEQQRAKPANCWQLWKEGRGTNEAHQRGGKLLAVEYVESAANSHHHQSHHSQSPDGGVDDKRTRVDLDTASFDGFSVIWTPGMGMGLGPEGTAVVANIAVRFNFLSTDFSHSKGVKGIPVRLCAKTSILPPLSPDHSPNSNASPPQQQSQQAQPQQEVSYCKVKLFRDHGAERKLSNDVAHVKKSIDKLKQQIAQAETGMKDFSKRKRTASTVSKSSLLSSSSQLSTAHSQGGDPSHRPGKATKHKRTWSMSSTSSAGGGNRVPQEEDLHYKLRAMQDMFTSTRPVSVLYLRGTEEDDPDVYPVALVGEPVDLMKVEGGLAGGMGGPGGWQGGGMGPGIGMDSHRGRGSIRSGSVATTASVTGSLVSPSPSSISLHSQLHGHGVVSSSSVPPQSSTSAAIIGGPPWTAYTGLAQAQPGPGLLQSTEPQQLASPPDVTRVSRTDDAGCLSGWIEALGVDGSYRPPVAEPRPRPVACFYVKQLQRENEYYRAVYLMERSVSGFVDAAAKKFALDASRVARLIRVVGERGLEVGVDDDVIRELAEGQDMGLEVVRLGTQKDREREREKGKVKREWEMSVDEGEDAPADVDVDVDVDAAPEAEQYELRLVF